MANSVTDRLDFLQGHRIYRFVRYPLCPRPLIGVESAVGIQIQFWIVELSVNFLYRSS